MDDDILLPIIICSILFIGLPWVIFHYITKWKTAATLTWPTKSCSMSCTMPPGGWTTG